MNWVGSARAWRGKPNWGLGEAIHGPPADIVYARSRADRHLLGRVEKREVGDGYGAAARVAARVTEGVQLLKIGLVVLEAGALGEQARGGRVQRLVWLDGAAGQGPGVSEGLLSALDK